MGKRRILAVFAGLLLSGSAFAQGGASRPILLLFESRTGTPAATQAKVGDLPEETQRIPASLRAMRRAFLDEGGVEPLIFTLDTPTIARAVLDAKVTLNPDAPPTEEEQLKIAAACGATYVLNIHYTTTALSADTQAIPGAPETPEKIPTLEVESIELKQGKTPAPGKRWRDTIRVSDGLSTSQVSRREGLSDALNTAARTLVLRFLGQPALRELRRRTPNSAFLPSPVTPPTTPDAGDDMPPQERAAQALKRAEVILNEGNTEEGLRAVRRAINLAPRALAPRLTLIRTWEKLQRPDRIEEEAERALSVADPAEPATLRNELVLLLGKTRQANGDLEGAKESFAEALRLDEKNRAVRLALAQILVGKGELESAEPHFTRLLQDKPDDAEAALGLARILTLKGDFDGVRARLSASSLDPAQRSAFVTAAFLETAMRLGARLTQNRANYEKGSLDKATFLTSIQAQAQRAAPLHKLLLATPPPATASESAKGIHKHYVLAASLLLQALTSMQTHLEKGDNAAAAQSRLYVGEFFHEMNEAALLAGQS